MKPTINRLFYLLWQNYLMPITCVAKMFAAKMLVEKMWHWQEPRVGSLNPQFLCQSHLLICFCLYFYIYTHTHHIFIESRNFQLWLPSIITGIPLNKHKHIQVPIPGDLWVLVVQSGSRWSISLGSLDCWRTE